MSGGGSRIKADRLLEVHGRLTIFALRSENEAQIVVGLVRSVFVRIAREFDRSAMILFCFCESPLFCEGRTKKNVCRCAGVKGYCLPEPSFGPLLIVFFAVEKSPTERR